MSPTHIMIGSGQWVDLANPRPGDFNLDAIAKSIAKINRWNGHTLRPLSVAEHSLLVAEIVERELGGDAHAQLAALLHDAHESNVGDASTPAKRAMAQHTDACASFEDLHMRTLRRAFGVVDASRRYAHLIKQADAMALATEWRDLMPSRGQPLPGCTAEPIGWVRLMEPRLCDMTWMDWASRFKDKADELDFARQPAGVAA